MFTIVCIYRKVEKKKTQPSTTSTRLFIPVGVYEQSILLYDKDEQGNVNRQELMGVRVS